MKLANPVAVAIAVLVFSVSLTRSAAAAPDIDAQRDEVRRHFESGLAHFNLREYKQAIEEFQAAYRLRPDPVFLYNLGQAYRLADDPEQALYFYRSYLRTSEDAPNRREVEDRIAALEKVIADKRKLATPPDHALPPGAQKNAQAAASKDTRAAAATAGPATPAPKPTPLYRRWWLWTAVGVVVAGAAVGVGVGVASQKPATFDANVGTVGPAALIQVRY